MGTEPTPPATTPHAENHHLYRMLGWPGRIALLFAPPMLIALGWGTGYVVHSKYTPGLPVAAVVAPHPDDADGVKLYTRHCAQCHGAKGDGSGVAALSIRARAFGAEKFKLACTDNGVPTDDELMRIIRRGIPGSAMPGFDTVTMTDEQCAAVVNYVRRLTRRGVYERLFREALKKFDDGGDDPDPHALAVKAATMCQPGKPVTVPVKFESPTPDSLARGKKSFMTICASCHGPEGRGDGPQVKGMKNEDGTPNKPRDLTAGVYKGGDEPERLYARIRLGIPGTPMPATTNLSPSDMADLIHYVRSLAQPPERVAAEAAAGVAAGAGK